MDASLSTRLRRLYLVTLVMLSAGAPQQSRAQSRTRADSMGIAQTASAFLVAFDSLRWEPFATFWSIDATVFLPDTETPHLLVGRTAVFNYFRSLFADVRSTAHTATPTLGILPTLHDLRIHLLGPTTALVTFELGRGKNPGRRTTLWQWNSTVQAWQLVHLHASTLSAP